MAKRPERNFLKPTQISRHLNCSICAEVFFEPMRLFCGHTFCHTCITEWAAKNKTCPICRKDVELGLMGKDLISEKIIMDLEVRCTNRLCDWKDRLENLPKHLKSCAFAKTPDWLNEAQNFIKLDENKEESEMPFLVQHDDHFIERVNEEVSRKSLLERLYTKNEESKELVDSVFNKSNSKSKEKGKGKGKGKGGRKGKKNEVSKGKSFEDYQDFLCTLDDSDEETKEGHDNQGSSEISSKKESVESKQGEVAGKNGGNEETLGSIIVKNSQETNKTELVNENQDLLDQDVPEEQTIVITTRLRSGRMKGRTQKNSGEPKLIKKSKTVA